MTENKNAFGFIPELPEEIRQPYQYICQELASISNKWKLYKNLFSLKENIDVINNTAPSAFQMLEESLRIDIAMSISKLADPKVSKGKENLSVERLVNKVSRVKGLSKAISKFKILSEPIITLRDKHFAHNDLSYKLYPKANPFPVIGQNTIDSIIKSLSEILNLIVSYYKDVELMFESLGSDDGRDLIFWLKEALIAQKKSGLPYHKMF